ncbi:trypsin-like peptidase domain-containing protein [Crocinitomix catalasitica]|uniref:trypsin-like peptidase domain-containing protein n=1 Tax=Crocinitomix catalasitica TaxID=184607 RepID=UPI00048061BA|nr:trypsin-like peptidase domain-containing protein [Crocinitomix catalasitica]
MKYLFIIFLIPFISCNNSQKKAEKENWKTDDYINQKQILLTNEYRFGQSSSSGASAFLVESKNNTSVICTAKHLLGDAMGISPEVSSEDFSEKLDYWITYPRNNKLSNDTFKITELINKEINSTDIILMEYDNIDANTIQVLKPRLTTIKKGEKLEIIGCEHSDFSCHQKEYNAVMNEYDINGVMIIKSTKTFDASGFSGAPVIDKDGFVVGVLSGAAEFEGEYFLWVEPLTKVKQFFN